MARCSRASSAGLSAIIWLTVRSRSRASGSPASTWASSPPVPNRKRRNATSTDSPGPRLLTASSRWVSNPSNRAWATDTEVRAYGNAGVRVDLVESECTYHGETIAGDAGPAVQRDRDVVRGGDLAPRVA